MRLWGWIGLTVGLCGVMVAACSGSDQEPSDGRSYVLTIEGAVVTGGEGALFGPGREASIAEGASLRLDLELARDGGAAPDRLVARLTPRWQQAAAYATRDLTARPLVLRPADDSRRAGIRTRRDFVDYEFVLDELVIDARVAGDGLRWDGAASFAGTETRGSGDAASAAAVAGDLVTRFDEEAPAARFVWTDPNGTAQLLGRSRVLPWESLVLQLAEPLPRDVVRESLSAPGAVLAPRGEEVLVTHVDIHPDGWWEGEEIELMLREGYTDAEGNTGTVLSTRFERVPAVDARTVFDFEPSEGATPAMWGRGLAEPGMSQCMGAVGCVGFDKALGEVPGLYVELDGSGIERISTRIYVSMDRVPDPSLGETQIAVVTQAASRGSREVSVRQTLLTLEPTADGGAETPGFVEVVHEAGAPLDAPGFALEVRSLLGDDVVGSSTGAYPVARVLVDTIDTGL